MQTNYNLYHDLKKSFADGIFFLFLSRGIINFVIFLVTAVCIFLPLHEKHTKVKAHIFAALQLAIQYRRGDKSLVTLCLI